MIIRLPFRGFWCLVYNARNFSVDVLHARSNFERLGKEGAGGGWKGFWGRSCAWGEYGVGVSLYRVIVSLTMLSPATSNRHMLFGRPEGVMGESLLCGELGDACLFRCLYKDSGVKNLYRRRQKSFLKPKVGSYTFSQTLHLSGFSLSRACVWRWIVNAGFCMNPLPQWLHLCGFSLVCVFSTQISLWPGIEGSRYFVSPWRRQSDFRANPFAHSPQTCGFPLVSGQWSDKFPRWSNVDICQSRTRVPFVEVLCGIAMLRGYLSDLCRDWESREYHRPRSEGGVVIATDKGEERRQQIASFWAFSLYSALVRQKHRASHAIFETGLWSADWANQITLVS